MRIVLTVTILAVIVLQAHASAQTTIAPIAEKGQFVRAAGMPLEVGDLAPGMLAVRVVRGAFENDLQGVIVHAQVTGGQVYQATTGADGRAQFAHLPVGAEVRAWASLSSGTLESSVFTVPATAGVRVLLVADGNATASLGTAAQPLATPVYQTASTVSRFQAPKPRGVTLFRNFLMMATVLASALLWYRHRPRHS